MELVQLAVMVELAWQIVLLVHRYIMLAVAVLVLIMVAQQALVALEAAVMAQIAVLKRYLGQPTLAGGLAVMVQQVILALTVALAS